jgi:hypothetical protein
VTARPGQAAKLRPLLHAVPQLSTPHSLPHAAAAAEHPARDWQQGGSATHAHASWVGSRHCTYAVQLKPLPVHVIASAPQSLHHMRRVHTHPHLHLPTCCSGALQPSKPPCGGSDALSRAHNPAQRQKQCPTPQAGTCSFHPPPHTSSSSCEHRGQMAATEPHNQGTRQLAAEGCATGLCPDHPPTQHSGKLPGSQLTPQSSSIMHEH